MPKASPSDTQKQVLHVCLHCFYLIFPFINFYTHTINFLGTLPFSVYVRRNTLHHVSAPLLNAFYSVQTGSRSLNKVNVPVNVANSSPKTDFIESHLGTWDMPGSNVLARSIWELWLSRQYCVCRIKLYFTQTYLTRFANTESIFLKR